jgi:PAS domain S-box-containing protein
MSSARWVPDKQVRVLLAGASPAIAASQACLSEAGYRTRLARGLRTTLAVLDETSFELVVVEWLLPDGTGLQLCREIRARLAYPQPYMVILTPGGRDEPAQALRAGVDDYLITPFEDVQLLARVYAGARSVQLRDSEARLRTLLANAPGAVYRCANDPQWTMEFISNDIERISGYPSTDFIDNVVRSFASIIHPDDCEMVERDVAEATRQGQLFVLEYRIIRSDGGVAWVRERGQQVSGGNGRSWLDGVIFEITEWKATEDLLQESQRQLAVAADRERIARELHDGVIQALSGVLLTLQAADTVADQPDAVRHRLADSVDRIDLAVKELRDYVFDLRPASLTDRHLHEALYRLAEDFQDNSGVVTAIDLDPAVAARLAADAVDILQLAREALSNVWRHARATTCQVSLRLVDGAAVLEIDDDGRGFNPAAEISRGQGLRNLRERSLRLGGHLGIDSGTTGTTVSVQLPLRAQADTAPAGD